MKKLIFALSLLGLTAFAAAPNASADQHHGYYRHHGYRHGDRHGYHHRHYHYRHGRRYYYGDDGAPVFLGPAPVSINIGL